MCRFRTHVRTQAHKPSLTGEPSLTISGQRLGGGAGGPPRCSASRAGLGKAASKTVAARTAPHHERSVGNLQAVPGREGGPGAKLPTPGIPAAHRGPRFRAIGGANLRGANCRAPAALARRRRRPAHPRSPLTRQTPPLRGRGGPTQTSGCLDMARAAVRGRAAALPIGGPARRSGDALGVSASPRRRAPRGPSKGPVGPAAEAFTPEV